MDDAVLFEELQGDQDLDGESSDQLLAKAVIVVADDQLIQIIAEKLKDNADVLPKNYEIFDPDNIGLSVVISLLDMRQDLDFDEGLLGKLRLTFDHLQCYLLLVPMVEYFQHLTIGTLTDQRQNLVAVGDMIIFDKFVLFSG